MPRRDTDIHFAADVPEASFVAHRGIHVSNDGAQVISGLQDIRPQKRSRRIEELGDDYGDWVPVPDDDIAEAQAAADTVTSYDVIPEEDEQDTGKRKRYKSSVCVFSSIMFFLLFFAHASDLDVVGCTNGDLATIGARLPGRVATSRRTRGLHVQSSLQLL